MADIMNTNWDEPMDEVTVLEEKVHSADIVAYGTAASLGLVGAKALNYAHQSHKAKKAGETLCKKCGHYPCTCKNDDANDEKATMDEVTVKQAAGAGALAGLAVGAYDGIKRHRLDKIKREERALKWYRLKNTIAGQHREDAVRRREIRRAKQDAELAKYRKMERDYNHDKDPNRPSTADKLRELKNKVTSKNEPTATVDEGVGKAVGLGLVGAATYGMTKNIVSDAVKDAADRKELAEYEHERAFRETPKETLRRITHRKGPKNESATVLSKVW